MKQHLLRIEPDFFNSNLLSGPDKIKECEECKQKEKSLQDLESRVKDLTEYIKQHKDSRSRDLLKPLHDKPVASTDSSASLKESSQSPKNPFFDH